LVIIQAYYLYLADNFQISNKASEYGDSFGALNAVFSGLAFAGVIVTVLIQMEELRATREELRKSALAQEESSKALNEQLRVAKLSSNMEILTNYINRLKNSNDNYSNEKSFKAGELINLTIREIYLKPEYYNLIKPNLWITDYKPKSEVLKRLNKINFDNSKFYFQLGNNGHTFKLTSASQIKDNNYLEIYRSDSGNNELLLPCPLEMLLTDEMHVIYNLRCLVTSFDWQIEMFVYPNHSNQIVRETIVLDSNGRGITKSYLKNSIVL